MTERAIAKLKDINCGSCFWFSGYKFIEILYYPDDTEHRTLGICSCSESEHNEHGITNKHPSCKSFSKKEEASP